MRMQKTEGRRQKGNTSPRPSPQRGEGEPLTLAELRTRGVVGLTKAQMAGVIQISVRSLNGMIARGEIAYWRIGKRLLRFRIEDAIKRMNETVLVAADGGDQ